MKKLAILGKLPTKHKAPFDDDNFDIWAFNKHTDSIKRVDVWFDLHENGNKEYPINYDNFPFKECEELVGGQYFNNSAAYLIAYAILQDYKEIYLYGMRFENSEEVRKGQFWNVRELIFFAKGKGINIYAPYDDILLRKYELYIDWRKK